MATVFWVGGAPAVAQVTTIQITAYDAATTYEVTIGGIEVSVTGTTDADGTASALQAALDASTHPYFTAITWTVATDTVTGTATTAGVPFVASSSVTGGTGTIGAATTSTASAGPNDWSTALNWSGGAVPVASDDVVISNSSANIVYGLDQSSVAIDSLKVEQTFTGELGLPYNKFATSANGETFDTSAIEYREHYLEIDVDEIEIGGHSGIGSPSGSGRIKIDNVKSGASTTNIIKTGGSSADSGFPAVRLLAANAGADIFVREARGGVGIALGAPSETSTVGDVIVSAENSNTQVLIGEGVTITNFEQSNGNNSLNAAATVTSVTVNGGQLTTEGDYTITTLELTEGTVFCNHVKTAGNAITTANLTGGTLDGTNSTVARTWATVNPDGGSIAVDDDYVTITTLDQPAGEKTITVS